MYGLAKPSGGHIVDGTVATLAIAPKGEVVTPLEGVSGFTVRRDASRSAISFPDLDEHGTPKAKLPNCPRCGEDELGVIHRELMMCYRCNWKLEK